MKTFIALLISTSILAAPIAFAEDQQSGADQGSMMQKMPDRDQASKGQMQNGKRKAHCRHCNCHYKNKSQKNPS